MTDREPKDAGEADRRSTGVTPPASFVEQANVGEEAIYDRFAADPEGAWAKAGDLLTWDEGYDAVLGGSGPPFRWFEGGRLNACVNCVDRHLPARKNQLAIRWEGRLGETRTYTYRELQREVDAVAAGLRARGVRPGDVVTTYMPVVPELPIVMLAAARLGAPHNVVLSDLGADAVASRMRRAGSSTLVTCDGYYHQGEAVALKNRSDTVSVHLDADVTTVVVDRLGENYAHSLGADEVDYGELVATHEGTGVEPVSRRATDDLFQIYTSGTTGRPKAVTHTTGGYLAQAAWTSHAVLDLTPEDIFWCATDINWITGHTYAVYGPLALGSTTLLHEGSLAHAGKDRPWELIERHGVDVFYTAPSAIRTFVSRGAEHPRAHDLSSLRLLGTVGEPITPQTWWWYYTHVGGESCPIVDTWWQTETGAMLLSTLPALRPTKPGSPGPPLPGVSVAVVDRSGEPVEPGASGYLLVDRPWPAMPQELCRDEGWGREARREGTTPSDGRWAYPTADGAVRDEWGYVDILGRLDDVIRVSGHRFGTDEIEAPIVGVDGVAEAAVVEGPGEDDGSGVHAYVRLAEDVEPAAELRGAIAAAVENAVGPLASPDRVVFTPELPKTNSGKIMRRLLESVGRDDDLGDLSALRNPGVVGELELASRED
jgi:acetyl-CoA synthetase